MDKEHLPAPWNKIISVREFIAQGESDGDLDMTSAADIPLRPHLKNGQTWGPWKFRLGNLTLTHVEQDYEIDLERCLSPGQVLDWIYQIYLKAWKGDDIRHLLRAFQDILDPQASLCSGGSEKHLTKAELKKRIKGRIAGTIL